MTTKRRGALALLIIPALLLLSSCVRMQFDFKINSADDIDVTMNIGVDKQIASGQAGMTGEQLCTQANDRPADAKVEPYEDDKFVGCKITGKGKAGQQGITYDESTGQWAFHLPGSEVGGGGQEVNAEMLSDFRVSVTFPGKVLTHSGSSTVSGSTVVWTDPKDLFSAEGLKATADSSGPAGGNLLMWILLGVVALLVIGVAVYFLVLRKKPAATPPASQGYPAAPQGYQPQGYQSAPEGYHGATSPMPPAQQLPSQQAPMQTPPMQPPAYPTQPSASPPQPPASPTQPPSDGYPRG